MKIWSIIIRWYIFWRKQQKEQLTDWFSQLKKEVIKLHNEHESGKYWKAAKAAATGIASTAGAYFLAKNPAGAGVAATGAVGTIGFILYPSNTPPVAILSFEQIRDTMKKTERVASASSWSWIDNIQCTTSLLFVCIQVSIALTDLKVWHQLDLKFMLKSKCNAQNCITHGINLTFLSLWIEDNNQSTLLFNLSVLILYI